MSPLDLVCTGVPAELCSLLKPCLEQAADALELAGDFAKIHLIMDDIEGCEEPWLRFAGHGDEQGVELYFSTEIFVQNRFELKGIFPQNEIWEAMEAPRQAVTIDLENFRPEFCLQYLHHHLLTARDIARKDLILGRVPANVAESYQVCWAVTVDGRLENWNLPGFALPERRRHFSRLFSQAGVLMPSHWSIFQALWEGDISGQRPVLEAVGGLPRL